MSPTKYRQFTNCKPEVNGKPAGNACTWMHACTDAQTDGQPKNIMPPAPSTDWVQAQKSTKW